MNKSNIQVKTSKSQGRKKAVITLKDELSIYTIEEIKVKLLDTIKKNEEIELITKDVKNMDLSFVQLLYSIIMSAEERGKKVNCNIELNDENKILFDNTDLTRIIEIS